MENNPLVTEIVTFPSYQVLPSTEAAPSGSSWSWSDIFKPVADVLTAGAGLFAQVYPAIKGTTPQTGYPSPNPQTPNQKAPAGYQFDPATGKLVPIGYKVDSLTGQLIPLQAGITASPYFWPVIAGLGAMFLVTSGSKKKR